MSEVEAPVDAILAEKSAGAGARKAPGALIAICVIIILLGGLGTLQALWGIVGSIFTEQLQSSFMMGPMPTGPGGSQEMADLMQEMQEKVNAVVIQFRWHLLAASLVHVVVAPLLLVGAIRTLKLKAAGRLLLIVACCLAIPFEFGRSILQTYMMMQHSSIMNNYFPQMFESVAPAGAPGPPVEFIVTMMKIGTYAVYAFTLAFVLAKIVLYVVTIKYLNSPRIKPLFGIGGSEEV